MRKTVMGRIHGKLSALAVKNAVKRGMYSDGGGLYLSIAKNGSKSWVLRYRLGGRRRYCGLGSLLRVTLAEARKRAAEARAVLLNGDDPIAIKQGQRTAARLSVARAMTFQKAADSYIASHRAGWSKAFIHEWTASLGQYVYPLIGALPVQDIDTALVMKVVEPIWASKTTTASRIRSRIKAVLDWATARGFRSGDNPARWDGHLQNLLPAEGKLVTVKHMEAMPYAEVPAFMSKLRQHPHMAARALEFLILTAARRSEAMKADWSELDLLDRVWVMPGARMKAGKEHRVPLSDAVMQLLGSLPGPHRGPVFPSRRGKPMNHGQLRILLRSMDVQDITVHGFRSTFVDWAHEQTNFPSEAIEMSLAHSVGNAVEQSYRRTNLFDRRRLLMSAWSDFCAGKHQVSADVVELKRASA
jgi:integrase